MENHIKLIIAISNASNFELLMFPTSNLSNMFYRVPLWGPAKTLILLIELSVWFVAYLFSRLSSIDSALLSFNAFSFSSLHTLGEKLYVDYFYISQGTMLILLVTVIGFVVLTIKKSETLRRDKNILSLEQNHSNTDSS